MEIICTNHYGNRIRAIECRPSTHNHDTLNFYLPASEATRTLQQIQLLCVSCCGNRELTHKQWHIQMGHMHMPSPRYTASSRRAPETQWPFRLGPHCFSHPCKESNSSVFLGTSLGSVRGADVSPRHNSRVSQQPWLWNAAEQQEDGQSFSDTFHLIYEPQNDHRSCFIGSSSVVKGLHCCTCKGELKTSSFSSAVWCRVPWGSPSRPWRSSGTISQWTPQCSHTGYRGAQEKFPCFAGWALPPL